MNSNINHKKIQIQNKKNKVELRKLYKPKKKNQLINNNLINNVF